MSLAWSPALETSNCWDVGVSIRRFNQAPCWAALLNPNRPRRLLFTNTWRFALLQWQHFLMLYSTRLHTAVADGVINSLICFLSNSLSARSCWPSKKGFGLVNTKQAICWELMLVKLGLKAPKVQTWNSILSIVQWQNTKAERNVILRLKKIPRLST